MGNTQKKIHRKSSGHTHKAHPRGHTHKKHHHGRRHKSFRYRGGNGDGIYNLWGLFGKPASTVDPITGKPVSTAPGVAPGVPPTGVPPQNPTGVPPTGANTTGQQTGGKRSRRSRR